MSRRAQFKGLSDRFPVWFDRVGIESRVLHPQRDFIVSIPDLIGNPHIRIDFATQITYFNLLCSGMTFHEDQDVEQGHYGKQIFCQILLLIPQWEQEASGTAMDFLASFLTVCIPQSKVPSNQHRYLSLCRFPSQILVTRCWHMHVKLDKVLACSKSTIQTHQNSTSQDSSEKCRTIRLRKIA